MPDPLAVLIRELRTRRGLSLQALGRLVEASAPHLYNIESGLRLPSEELAARIARELGMDPGAFRAWVQASGRSDWGTTRRATILLDQFVREPRIARLMAETGVDAGAKADRLSGPWPATPPMPAPAPLPHAASAEAGPARVLVPILEPGRDPDERRGMPWSRGPSLRLDPGRLVASGIERPFAYPLGPGLHPRAAGALPDSGCAVLTREAGWPPLPGAIYAARFAGPIELAPVMWNGSEVLVLPAPGHSDFVVVRVADARAGGELLRGRVVLIAAAGTAPAAGQP